ncbi:MAG TPA: amino acid racemase [Xanthomonadales bacterium]|nr:amino acid racemase [Xanthomonadales bacterium]
MKNRQAIGVLGGMSPLASRNMYDRLIQLSMQYFGAIKNDDFPEIILHSIPVPDFISNSKDKYRAFDMLKDRVKDLNKLNISCLSIACNTAHVLLEDLQIISKAPFMSMIDEVVKTVVSNKIKKIGILGSPLIIRSRLYQSRLEKFNIDSIVPNNTQQQVLDRIIRNVISGDITKKDSKLLSSIADELVSRGARGIILGCTELPIIFPLQYKITVYNSVEILSMALLRRYYESNKINTV